MYSKIYKKENFLEKYSHCTAIRKKGLNKNGFKRTVTFKKWELQKSDFRVQPLFSNFCFKQWNSAAGIFHKENAWLYSLFWCLTFVRFYAHLNVLFINVKFTCFWLSLFLEIFVNSVYVKKLFILTEVIACEVLIN